jgi:hypothetical protein
MPIEIQLRSVQLLQHLIVVVPFQLDLTFSVLLTGFVRLNLVANLSFQICFPLSWSPKYSSETDFTLMRLLSIVLIQSFIQTGLKCIDGLIEFVGECNLI